MKIKTKMLKKFISILCAATMVASGAVVSVGASGNEEDADKQMKLLSSKEEKEIKINAKKKILNKNGGKNKESKEIQTKTENEKKKNKKKLNNNGGENKENKGIKEIQTKTKNETKKKTKPFWLKCVEEEKEKKQEEEEKAIKRKAKIQENKAKLAEKVKALQGKGDPKFIERMQEYKRKSQLKLKEKAEKFRDKVNQHTVDIEWLLNKADNFRGPDGVSIRGALTKLKTTRDKSWSSWNNASDAIYKVKQLLAQQYGERKQLLSDLIMLNNMNEEVIKFAEESKDNIKEAKKESLEIALQVIKGKIVLYNLTLADCQDEIVCLKRREKASWRRYNRVYNSLFDSLENLECNVESEIKEIEERIKTFEADEKNYKKGYIINMDNNMGMHDYYFNYIDNNINVNYSDEEEMSGEEQIENCEEQYENYNEGNYEEGLSNEEELKYEEKFNEYLYYMNQNMNNNSTFTKNIKDTPFFKDINNEGEGDLEEKIRKCLDNMNSEEYEEEQENCEEEVVLEEMSGEEQYENDMNNMDNNNIINNNQSVDMNNNNNQFNDMNNMNNNEENMNNNEENMNNNNINNGVDYYYNNIINNNSVNMNMNNNMGMNDMDNNIINNNNSVNMNMNNNNMNFSNNSVDMNNYSFSNNMGNMNFNNNEENYEENNNNNQFNDMNDMNNMNNNENEYEDMNGEEEVVNYYYNENENNEGQGQ